MKSILFFGDSNTWGYMPAAGERYPYEQRWTSIAASILGADYNCIPAGMNGRTSVFDDPWKACRNGRDALDIELQTHKPLDLAVIMLGTNDLKFGSAEMAARGAETLVMMAKDANERFSTSSPVFPNGARVLLAAPILIGEGEHSDSDLVYDGYAESKKFARLYKAVADSCGVDFINAAAYARPSEIDCQHMTAEGHAAFGIAIADKIKSILE